jgi:hypothetical protein
MSVTASARLDRAVRAMNAAIVVHGLTKRFGQRTAVDDVDSEVPVGTQLHRPERRRQDDHAAHARRPADADRVRRVARAAADS